MPITFTSRAVGTQETVTEARKVRIDIYVGQRLEVHLQYGWRDAAGAFVASTLQPNRILVIQGADLAAMSSARPDGSKSFYDNISAVLDAYLTKSGVV